MVICYVDYNVECKAAYEQHNVRITITRKRWVRQGRLWSSTCKLEVPDWHSESKSILISTPIEPDRHSPVEPNRKCQSARSSLIGTWLEFD